MISPNGTTLTTPLNTIVDENNNRWSLRRGAGGMRPFINGLAAGTISGTVVLLYLDQAIYQQVGGNHWYVWQDTWTATLSPIPLAPAADSLTIFFAAATGAIARSEAFGVAVVAGNDRFATLTTPEFQAAVAAVGGFGMVRVHLDQALNQIFASRKAEPDWSHIDNIWSGMSQLNVRLLITLGLPPSWLDISNSDDQALYGLLAVQLAQRMADNGYPCTYWECISEPDSLGISIIDAANLNLQAALALKAYDPTYQIGGPVFAGNPAYRGNDLQTWATIVGEQIDFISYHYFSFASPDNNTSDRAAIRYAIAGSTAYGLVCNTTRNSVPGNLACCLSAYNIDGQPSAAELRQMTHVGAVYNTLALCDAVKFGNLDMGTIWQAVDEQLTYGIIDSTTWEPRPTAYTLGSLHAKMRGHVVPSYLSNMAANVYCLAVANGNKFCICIVNYDTIAVALNVILNDLTLNASLDYFEVSESNPMSKTQTIRKLDLSNLPIPPMSVVILS